MQIRNGFLAFMFLLLGGAQARADLVCKSLIDGVSFKLTASQVTGHGSLVLQKGLEKVSFQAVAIKQTPFPKLDHYSYRLNSWLGQAGLEVQLTTIFTQLGCGRGSCPEEGQAHKSLNAKLKFNEKDFAFTCTEN